MPGSAPYTDFIKDKRNFFSTSHSIQKINETVSKKNYQFLSNNKKLIEQEFQLLFASLRQNGEQRQEFWFYCYYCCDMLKTYHQAYATYAKVEEYEQLMQQIKQRCEPEELRKKRREKENFLEMLANKFANDLAEIADITLHASKLRSKIGLLNVYRIYWIFCRLTLTTGFAIARDAHLIDELNRLFDLQINVDNIIQTMEAPNAILRVFSVGFFAARFMINAGMLVKHVLVPSKKEQSKSMTERFTSELWKRHADLLNDIVWGTVNGLSNYAEVFHISAPVAGWLTAGFLLFDVSLLLWRRKLLEDDYLLKKAELRADLRYWQDRLEKDGSPASKAHYKVVLEQLTELEITWNSTSSTYLFNVAAACCLALGFSASMLLTPAIFVMASYALCSIGVAMYLSADTFGRFRESSLRLEQANVDNAGESNEKNTLINYKNTLADYEANRNEFIYTMVKNIVLPGLLITTLAVCWQAALVMTAMYLLSELLRTYLKHRQVTPELLPVIEADAQDAAGGACLGCAG